MEFEFKKTSDINRFRLPLLGKIPILMIMIAFPFIVLFGVFVFWLIPLNLPVKVTKNGNEYVYFELLYDTDSDVEKPILMQIPRRNLVKLERNKKVGYLLIRASSGGGSSQFECVLNKGMGGLSQIDFWSSSVTRKEALVFSTKENVFLCQNEVASTYRPFVKTYCRSEAQIKANDPSFILERNEHFNSGSPLWNYTYHIEVTNHISAECKVSKDKIDEFVTRSTEIRNVISSWQLTK